MSLMLLALLLGFAAIVVDVGFFLHGRERIQHITDAAALAGAQELPDDAIAAEDIAREWADRNGLDGDTIDIDFECRAGNPANCDPSGVDTIIVTGEMTAPVTLMPVLRFVGAGSSCWTTTGCTVEGTAAACRGECSSSSTDVDVVLIMDRTGSMRGTALTNAKEGARTLLRALDPQHQHVALAVLPAGEGDDRPDSCVPDNAANNWLLVGLSDDYQNPGGSLDTGSDLVATLNCLIAGGSTNIAAPMLEARLHLQSQARPGARQVIILLTDGAANQPDTPQVGTNPCAEANGQATIAKNADIEIYAIGYGVSGSGSGKLCDEDDVGTSWWNLSGELLVRAIATDAQHTFIEPANSDLTGEFQQIATALSTGSRLVD